MIAGSPIRKKTISSLEIKPQFLRPLLITVLIVIMYRLGMLVPIPFLDAEGSSGPAFKNASGHIIPQPFNGLVQLVENSRFCRHPFYL